MDTSVAPTMDTSIAPVMSDITLTNTLTSPLLRLPAELRNKIYTYVGLSTVVLAKIYGFDPYTPRFILPALLLSCKQIHHEASPLLYTHAIFDASRFFTLNPLKNAKPKMHSVITSIKVSDTFVGRAVVWFRGSGTYWPVGGVTLGAYLPKVERVYLDYRLRNYPMVRPALKRWFGNKSLELVFEER